MTTRLKNTDYEALASYRYALRKFLRFSKEYLAQKARLTPEQYEALLALKAFSTLHGLLVGEMSERLQVKHHTAVSLTDKLAQRNLVTKQRVGRDRRHVHVKLTPAGMKLLESLAFAHHKEIRHRSSEMIKVLKRLQK